MVLQQLQRGLLFIDVIESVVGAFEGRLGVSQDRFHHCGADRYAAVIFQPR